MTQRAYEMGAAGFFTKPFDPGALAEFVRSVVDEFSADGRTRAGTRSRRPF